MADEGTRVCLIVNPLARWHRRWMVGALIRKLNARGCAVVVRYTRRAGDAEQYAAGVLTANTDVLVVAGGDGTINEVINGLSDRDIALAILPVGTANVLAGEIGIQGVSRLARAIVARNTKPTFVGIANGRRFAVMVGVGFDCRVVERVSFKLKRRLGKVAYFLTTLSQITAYQPRQYFVSIDNTEYVGSAVLVAKGKYYGGRFIVTPNSRVTDPSFQIAIFERAGRRNLLRYAAALVLGLIPKLRDVKIYTSETLEIRGPIGEGVQADGDIVATLPLRITVDKNPIWVVRDS